MAESWDTKVLSYAPGDPGGDNKQLFLLRAPSAAFGGGITILSGEAVQGAAAALSQGVGGTTFTLALHKYTNAGTPAVYGTIAAAIGGTAVGWGAGVPNAFTITTSGSTNYLSAGEWLVCQYNEINAGNPVNATICIRYILGRGG
jgi:hypothetical protein